jgi:predicted transcriptional regulator
MEPKGDAMSAIFQPSEAAHADPAPSSILGCWRNGGQSIAIQIDDLVRYELKDETSVKMLAELVARLENIAAIQKGLDDVAAGRTVSLDEFARQVRTKNGL